jgi:glucose/arabinose dehydrogenase
MKRTRIAVMLAVGLICRGGGPVLADFLPGGYSGPTPVGGRTSDYLNITQMAFNPDDPNHLYATRYNFGQTSGVVTRYDYSTATGQVSNPVTIAVVPGATLGLAFFQDNLYVSTTNTSTNLGGIIRYQPGPGGTYGNPVEFVNNIPTGEHQVDQLQIQGNSLYVGIGTKTDAGINNTQGIKESVYNGTIGRIADLTKAIYSADGANNLALANVLSDTDPGRLHVFASGFRNPYGLLVTGAGRVLATDNGQDSPAGPDYVYKGLLQGDKGLFPTNNPGNLVQPFVNLGPLHTAPTGLAIVPTGANVGDLLVGLFHSDPNNPHPPLGNEVVLIDHATGAVIPSLTSLTSVTDIITDPNGRVLLADFGPNFDNGYNPNSGGIFELTSVPEPSTLALLLFAAPVAMAVVWRGRHARRSR